jgi:predicted HicB family RNase H-like nuclease
MPKGEAKAVFLRVRITPEERKAIEAKAKTGKQSVSDWIRGMLNAALQG